MLPLPRILVIDDQYARDDAEQGLFLLRLNAVEQGKQSRKLTHPVAEVVFCSGQQHTGNRAENDYRLIQRAVASGWGEESPRWSLVMLDVRFDSGAIGPTGLPEGQSGDDHFGEVVRQHLKQEFPNLPVVMLSGKRQQELQERETPYLSKDGLDEQAFKRCLLRYGQLTVDQTRNLLGLANDVVVASDRALVSYREAFVHARGDVSILVLGETGTGKEVLANYIHERSKRKGPFIGVNVAAIPKDLLESELFGSEKGAFTGAHARHIGRFEQANGGTLFLDEIGDMPLDAQVKVLRALQEREIYRVGGREPVKLDIRLVCATSRNLASMIKQGEFREDLYYRINTIQLELPPLRERPEDIIPLTKFFLERALRSAGISGVEFSEAAMHRLESYSFPGNVRELENIVTRLASSAGNYQVISDITVLQALNGSSISPSTSININRNIDEDKINQESLSLAPITLDNLSGFLSQVVIDTDTEVLRAVKPALDSAFRNIMQRAAGAALECCRDPVTGKLNRQRAMKLLSGNEQLKGKEPARLINRILNRPLSHTVSDKDLLYLIGIWKEAINHSGNQGKQNAGRE